MTNYMMRSEKTVESMLPLETCVSGPDPQKEKIVCERMRVLDKD